jgi:NAD(P)-dependent dehydrogenase (short-subunit alcohol dehydrogenase family)
MLCRDHYSLQNPQNERVTLSLFLSHTLVLNSAAVGVNHFGHFYLNHLLTSQLARDGKIVVTGSSVHDPDSPGGAQGVPATLGDLKGLQMEGKDCEMIDGTAFNADKAYKDSKVGTFVFEEWQLGSAAYKACL